MEPSSPGVPSPVEIAEQLLVQRTWLRALARKLAGEGESDDLVQDTWVAALEGPPEEGGKLRPWLGGVVRHLASGLRRKNARRGERERIAARPEALPATLELVERVDTEQRLARAVLALTEPVRTTLLLRFHGGLSAAEIARRQGVPAGTVRWRCKLGIDELRARLAKEFGDREALGLALAGLLRAPGTATGRTGQGAATAGAGGATAMIVTKTVLTGGVVLAAALGAWRLIEWRAPATTAHGSALQEARLAGSPASAELADVDPPGSQDSDQRALAGPPVTRIRVLESDGRPNADVTVAVAAAPGETHALSAATDADGWVEFPANGGRRRIAVERVSAFPFRTEIELAPGESTLELTEPEGVVLAGQVLVGGLAPPRPLLFLLHAASSAAVDLDVSDSSWPLDQDVTSCVTDTHGGLRFRGIAPGRGVNLRAPEGHARQGQRAFSDSGAGAVFHFEDPAEDVRIELERFPSVRGRVLEADGVTPVADASVELQFDGSLWGRQTGADGTFEIFAGKPPEHLRVKYGRWREWHALNVVSPEARTVEFDFHEPRQDTDLGDLVLTPSAGFFLEAFDRAGNPLDGVEAGACTETSTNVTDAAGRSWIAGLTPGTELALTHRGHRTAFVTLPDPSPETVSVVLAPANDLTLEVRGADGRPLDGVLLELAAPAWFLACGEPVSEAWRRNYHAGGGPGSWWRYWERNRGFEGRRGSIWGGAPTRIQFNADKEGRCSLGEIVPDTAPHLTVLDDVGAVLHEEELAPLGAEEQRVVQVRVSTPVAAVLGRVLSETGEPIAEASVTLGLAGGQEMTSRGTQADGRFRFARVGEHDLRLTVTKAGFLARELEPLHPSGAELELVLPRGYDVTVLVRDASGRPHAGGTARVRKPEEARSHHDAWTFADARGDGLFELGGLPGEPQEIVVELAAGLLRETWTPPRREVVIFVPEVGTVELAVRDPGAFPENFRPWLEPRGGGAQREIPLDGAPAGLIRFEQFAGDYDLVVEHGVGSVDGLQLTNRAVLRSFTVVAGETVRIQYP